MRKSCCKAPNPCWSGAAIAVVAALTCVSKTWSWPSRTSRFSSPSSETTSVEECVRTLKMASNTKTRLVGSCFRLHCSHLSVFSHSVRVPSTIYFFPLIFSPSFLLFLSIRSLRPYMWDNLWHISRVCNRTASGTENRVAS